MAPTEKSRNDPQSARDWARRRGVEENDGPPAPHSSFRAAARNPFSTLRCDCATRTESSFVGMTSRGEAAPNEARRFFALLGMVRLRPRYSVFPLDSSQGRLT